ncbi:MAG: TonB-dependent receptor, partial [Steroidobacteraceae bacterium]
WVGRYRSASGTLRVKAPLGFADFVSISGFREGVNHSGSEYDSTSADLGWFYSDILDKTWSQELQLLSTADSDIEWIAGLYWMDSDGGYGPLLVPGSPPIKSGGTQKSYAAYVQGRYEFNDQWGLTLGVRYSKDKAEYDGGTVGGFPVAPSADESWSDVSPKLTIDYKVGDSLLYFTASKGYKAGSYNLSNLANVGPVDPEKVSALEMGIKTELAGMARLEAALFHYDYKDLQVSFIPSNNNPTELANAADSKVSGLDLNALVQPIDALKLTGGLSWLFKAEYENFPGGTAYVDNAPFPGFSVVPGDFSGNRMAHAPKLTGNVGATYTWALPAGSIAANTNIHYRSKQYFSPQNLNSVANDDVTLVSAKVVYTSPDDHWTVSAWAQNLTDKEYFSGILQTTLGTIGIYALPRTYGFNVGYQW